MSLADCEIREIHPGYFDRLYILTVQPIDWAYEFFYEIRKEYDISDRDAQTISSYLYDKCKCA